MNRKYNLKLDLQFRCNNSTMKFNQFDNNTSDFFMRITNGGNLVDIEKAIVVLAIIKPSGKVSSQFVEVKNGLVYADLKPNMRDEIGTYTAQAMLILEDERVVTDVISYEVEEDKIFSLLNDSVGTSEEFTLLTDMLNRLSTIETSEEQRVINEAERILSEENRKIEEAKRVEAELIRQHEEADRAKYDATRESNENIRKQNESIRLANETNRVNEEAKRVEEEAKRVEAEQLRKDNYNFMTEDEDRRRSEANSHKEAEVLRVQAETNRVNEEAKRRTTEQARVSAENTRVSNENTRKANETTRQTNETHRVEAETKRQNRYNSFIANAEANASNFENYTNAAKVKEEERKSNELNRKSQEDRRVSNEVERISNENTRRANEAVRENNETTRQNIFENKVDEVDTKISELNTTKDNFVSNINTKVDNKISEIDNVKDNFVSSVNTKVDNKISELDSAKSDMTNTVSNKVNEVENRFNALTSKQQQDAEVIDARDGETSLKARLDRDIEKAKQVYANVEGSHISTDSSVGYLKDVEILGNTIQSASNLADIRSVGDKVEGQELYEIPVLSVGKNLLTNKLEDFIDETSYKKITINLEIGKDYILSTNCPLDNGSANLFIGGVLTNTNGCWNTAPRKIVGNGKVDVYIKKSFVSGTFEDFFNGRYYIQLEEGTQVTPYEPYIEDKLTILSPTPLEKVGDVRDRIIEKDVVLGVEKSVVDFSKIPKNWGTRTNDSGLLTFECNISKPYGDVDGNKLQIICSKLVGKDYNTLYNNPSMEGIGIKCYNNNLVVRVNISSTKLISQDINGIIKYLDDAILKTIYNTPQFIPLPHDQQVKLRTFAGKTNISFGCEIDGTIKAQVPKSLGATVNTHTEQINNLNKELDRVKKLEESTVSTVTTESDFTTVEATSNGYFEDVKLEGKTLVNLATQPTNNGSVNHQYATISTVANIKPSTVYTYIIRNNGSETLKLYLNHNGGFDWFDLDVEANSTVIGKAKTLPTIEGDIWLSLKKAETIEQNLQVVLLEGDHTQNPPSYFEGLKSVGQSATTSKDGVDEIVVSSIKGDGNLFDGEFENGSIGSDGLNHNEAGRIRTSYTRVKKGSTIFISFDCEDTRWFGYSYDKSKKPIGRLDVNRDGSITLPSNCEYVRFRTQSEATNHQISYKNVSYIPYQADKKRLLYYNTETQTWEKPILRQWDSIEKHANGKYYYHQRSGEVMLNGSENWIIDNNNTRFGLYNIDSITGNVNVNVEQISDKFSVYDRYGEKIGSFGVGTGFVRIQNNFGFTTATELKQWLQTNNVTVVYQLAQEKVYECTNIDLITYANETNYIVECGAISPKTTLKVHNNISNVVSLLQKKVSLLESDITSYMITQNRLMLASRYNSDAVSFKVDYAVCSENMSQENYDTDLYNLILNNILVGKDNYDYDHMFNIIMDYASWSQISWDQFDILVGLMDIQHNPPIEEIPTDDEIVEEIPNEIM